ncbi:MAG: FG-GAP repeat domain-containing protein, partial [Phycisphaerae bacterium]
DRATIADLKLFFAPECVFHIPRPETGRITHIGGIEVHRRDREELITAKPSDARSALAALLAIHRRSKGIRIKFKIIGIQSINETEYQTEALFQSHSTEASIPRIQQNANWTITWVRKNETDGPLIRAISMERLDDITCDHPLFTDCTRSIITDNAVWTPQLALGCEYWYGRVDAVGEINFMGHNGIAVGDVNGDGLDDLYVAQGTGLPNRLFVQNADGTARETALEAGVAWLDDTKGVLIVDIDNDGDQDLLCAIGPVIVNCVNDGSGRFAPRPVYRARTPASIYSLAAADYDLDGDLDLYACRYVKVRYGTSVPVPFHDANNGPKNFLLRNDGVNGFVDVTGKVGLDENNTRFSLAATWIDIDADGDPDLAVANDFGRNNLYRNEGGRFRDAAAEVGVEDQAAGMGLSWSDFDLDGDFDLYVSNMFSSAGRRVAYQSRFMATAPASARGGARRHSLGNSLFANDGKGRFQDRSDVAGVRMGRWAWGAKFVDFNNDAYDDLIVPNGFLTNQHKDDL